MTEQDRQIVETLTGCSDSALITVLLAEAAARIPRHLWADTHDRRAGSRRSGAGRLHV